jgi:hypothetical protein
MSKRAALAILVGCPLLGDGQVNAFPGAPVPGHQLDDRLVRLSRSGVSLVQPPGLDRA